MSSGIDAVEFSLLLALVLGLGTCFLALSFLISILSRDHARGVASSVLVWILSVLVFDLVLVGVLIGYPGEIPKDLFGALLLLNPTDIFRLIAFSLVGSAASPLGLATVTPPFPVAFLLAVLFLWAAAPLLLSHHLFRKRVSMDVLI